MKPVLTPVRHTAKRRHKSMDSQPGQLRLQLPTRFDPKETNASTIRVQQCIMDGVAALAEVQKRHAQLARQLPCAPPPPPPPPCGHSQLCRLLARCMCLRPSDSRNALMCILLCAHANVLICSALVMWQRNQHCLYAGRATTALQAQHWRGCAALHAASLPIHRAPPLTAPQRLQPRPRPL